LPKEGSHPTKVAFLLTHWKQQLAEDSFDSQQLEYYTVLTMALSTSTLVARRFFFRSHGAIERPGVSSRIAFASPFAAVPPFATLQKNSWISTVGTRSWQGPDSSASPFYRVNPSKRLYCKRDFTSKALDKTTTNVSLRRGFVNYPNYHDQPLQQQRYLSTSSAHEPAADLSFELDDRDELFSKEEEQAEEHKRRKLSDVRDVAVLLLLVPWKLLSQLQYVVSFLSHIAGPHSRSARCQTCLSVG
jgi:hypothetical protein